MHEIFIGADQLSYASRTLTVRLHGVVAHIRLENLFWIVLEEIGRRDGIGIVQLVERLHDELIAERSKVGDFAAFLRVTALRYQALMALGRIPVDVRVPLRSLDPCQVLKALPDGFGPPAVGLDGERGPWLSPAVERVRFSA